MQDTPGALNQAASTHYTSFNKPSGSVATNNYIHKYGSGTGQAALHGTVTSSNLSGYKNAAGRYENSFGTNEAPMSHE